MGYYSGERKKTHLFYVYPWWNYLVDGPASAWCAIYFRGARMVRFGTLICDVKCSGWWRVRSWKLDVSYFKPPNKCQLRKKRNSKLIWIANKRSKRSLHKCGKQRKTCIHTYMQARTQHTHTHAHTHIHTYTVIQWYSHIFGVCWDLPLFKSVFFRSVPTMISIMLAEQ